MLFWCLGHVGIPWCSDTWSVWSLHAKLEFFELLRFLMISKGSWVALATCSAESPIASKRCAVSVLASCLPSTLPSSILPGKVAEKVLWLHASTWRRILKWFNQATQVVLSASSDVSVSWCRRLDKLTDTSPLAYAAIFVTRCSHICNPMQPYSWIVSGSAFIPL